MSAARGLARFSRAAAAAAFLALLSLDAPAGALAATRVLDPFEDTAGWSSVPASGVLMKLTSEPGLRGRALRLDFDFQKGGGYAVLRRALDLPLPANYRFCVSVRGACGPQNFEFKLIDSSGENVWWNNRRDFAFPLDWQTIATRKRQIEFAWGPIGGGDMARVAAIEFAITAGSGGSGTVWLDELTFEELPPGAASPPRIVASGEAAPGFEAARAVDGDSSSGWRPRRTSRELTLDLGVVREFGGVRLDWAPEGRAPEFQVRVATEPGQFRTVRKVVDARGTRDWLFLPDTEARWIRVVLGAPAPAAELREITLQPLEFGASLNRFYEAIAKASPRGHYPRGMRGEEQFWAVVGTAGGTEENFLSEDGAVDLGTSRPSIEPFLWADGRLWTWADVVSHASLDGGSLPLPALTWHGAPVELSVRAVRAGANSKEHMVVSYGLANRGRQRRDGSLFLALRPIQVNPPSQFLNTLGGVCGVRSIDGGSGKRIEIDSLMTLVPEFPYSFGASAFDEGGIAERLSRRDLPARLEITDPNRLASGALRYDFTLAPGESVTVRLAAYDFGTVLPRAAPAAEAAAVRSGWQATLGPARISLPSSASEIERTLAAQIGWIEVNRDGPAIQPGSRAYARSWIRDGALTCSALLRWGKREPVKTFLEWFATHQYADGKVPCCVDQRGSDPVPEHDSHGQFIYLAAEYFRHSGDRATIERLWPHLASAAAYLDTLRAQRRGPEWRDSSRREFFGILPPSISHEGYSAKPMHSYWDDFWGVRGYQDAAQLARAIGRESEAKRLDASLAEFRRDFAASIAAAQAKHRIGFVPGCADLGDFDATSTTMALSPVQAADLAPAGTLEATFERYWQFFVRRRDGTEKWDAFTPYEIRNVGAFVRLGWRDRAHELVRWFLDQRSPPGWAQWAEVVYNATPTARFVGDIPHTWVGSDFVRSILDCFAYERESDDALVIAHGVPETWIREDKGVSVQGLSTWYGPLSCTMRAEGRTIVVRIQPGLRIPRGGIVVSAPGITARSRAIVNGKRVAVGARGEVLVRVLPATVRLEP